MDLRVSCSDHLLVVDGMEEELELSKEMPCRILSGGNHPVENGKKENLISFRED